MASDEVAGEDGKNRERDEQGPERAVEARFSPEEEKV